MSKHIDFQTIMQDGKPAFAVVPYDEFMRIIKLDEPTIPHEVAAMVLEKDFCLARAWREHLGLTQAEVARRMDISQAALSQIEKGDKTIRESTLKRLADAMGLNPEQLKD